MNSTLGEGKRVWEQDGGAGLKGINAFRASEAVRNQDERLFVTFHRLLLDARRKEFRDIAAPDVLKDVADLAGADIDRFISDYENPAILEGLERDHFHAVDELNIFGTPTFVFNGDNPVYLKLAAPDIGDNLTFFHDFIHIAVNRLDVWEIKRPY